MKNLTKMFLILTIGLLVCCSSEDSSDSNTDSDAFKTEIVGTWELSSLTLNGLEFVEDPDCLNRLVFTATIVKSIEYYDYEDGNGCVLDYEEDAEAYSISGNMLTTSIEGQSITFEILTLNATTLKMKGTITEDGITYNIVQTFNKL